MHHGNFGKLVVASLVLFGAGCTAAQEPAPITNNEPTPSVAPARKTYTSAPAVLPDAERLNKLVTIKTAKGDIVFKTFGDTAPKTVSNFLTLANDGFYNGLTFHRREEGFVIQGGDPNGNGTGGPGYRFEDELSDSYTYKRGVVAMANAGPNTNGSQFFIMLSDYPLPKAYSIFGEVTSGMEVVDAIKVGDVMTEVTVSSAN